MLSDDEWKLQLLTRIEERFTIFTNSQIVVRKVEREIRKISANASCLNPGGDTLRECRQLLKGLKIQLLKAHGAMVMMDDGIKFPKLFFAYMVTKVGDPEVSAFNDRAEEACAETEKAILDLWAWVNDYVPGLKERIQGLIDSTKQLEKESKRVGTMQKHRTRFGKK